MALNRCIYRAYTKTMTDDFGDIGAILAAAPGFDRDDGNAPRVRARHDVNPGECEQAFLGEPFIVSADAKHSDRERRWRALGRTYANRYLFLVCTMRGTRIRVMQARRMNRKERRSSADAQARTQTHSDV